MPRHSQSNFGVMVYTRSVKRDAVSCDTFHVSPSCQAKTIAIAILGWIYMVLWAERRIFFLPYVFVLRESSHASLHKAFFFRQKWRMWRNFRSTTRKTGNGITFFFRTLNPNPNAFSMQENIRKQLLALMRLKVFYVNYVRFESERMVSIFINGMAKKTFTLALGFVTSLTLGFQCCFHFQFDIELDKAMKMMGTWP